MRIRNTKSFVHTKNYVNTFPNNPGAYLLTAPNGKDIYIGVTCNIRTRISQHFRNKHSKFLSFNVKILEVINTINPIVLNELEQKYIQLYKPNLNNLKASRYSTRPCKQLISNRDIPG
jgi:excinuclease UvrABC nuclease subunit